VPTQRLYTGVHLLAYPHERRQFGSVDAWADLPDLTTVVRLSIGKVIGDRIQVNENGVLVELKLEEASILLRDLNTVVEQIKHLAILSKSGKLDGTAYYSEG
jgi:hypothetical protein